MKNIILQPALFLDRDGVIINMVKYANQKEYFDSAQKPQDVNLIPGIATVVKWANQKHIPVVEISNQPGVAKGKMSQRVSQAIEHQTHRLLKKKGAKINYIYICPHHPQGIIPKLTKNCNCRKPKPGLLLKAAKELKINLAKSIFIGDSSTDVEAGTNAGCFTLLFLHTNNVSHKITLAQKSKPSFRSKNHQQTLTILKKFFT